MDVEILEEEATPSSDRRTGSSSNVFAVPSPKTPPLSVSRNLTSGSRTSEDSNVKSLYQQAARLGLTSDTDKFMLNFNPENSNRERRKLTRKIVQNYKRCYDSKGLLIISNKDVCDCLNEKCPGCFFPCPKCRSCKCGHECRQFRKWVYESAEEQKLRKVTYNEHKTLLKKKS